MSGLITPPKPGDLITISFVTSILDKLTELEGRIAALEKPSVRDSSIQISVSSFAPPTALDQTTNTIHVAGGASITLQAKFSLPGTYDLSFVQIAPTANWTIRPTFDTQVNFTIQPADIPPGAQASKTPTFTIVPTPGATPVAGPLEVHIKREGAPNDQFITFTLATT